jgi:signal transduction histidine kinase
MVTSDAGEWLLLADPLQIEVILRNLLANAFEATASLPVAERRIRVSARKLEDGKILFRVTDSGPGLSPSARKLLFEPFSTTKPMGMGLGLAISQAIAEAHGGSLAATPTQHGEFDLLLPSVAADE